MHECGLSTFRAGHARVVKSLARCAKGYGTGAGKHGGVIASNAREADMSTGVDADVRVLRHHMAVENAHQMEQTLATLTEDCVFDDRALGQVFTGHGGAAEYYRMWWDAFEVTVAAEHVQVAAEGTAAAQTWWRGRQVGPFLGVPATGREVHVPVAIFVELRDGRLAAERLYWDRLSVLRQLGAGKEAV
jgi:steroid delta-isomerase-like uncharacterized protein